MSDSRTNLGRGLAALFGEENEDFAALENAAGNKGVPIEQLHPNPRQPRQNFDDKAVRELAASIGQNGILQPILVRRHPERDGEFEIVAGERRWRAAQLARIHEVPVIVREVSDVQVLEVALVENVQRVDLNALEEADAYQRLVSEFGHSQDNLAQAVGKSRSHIANTLRLLALPDPVKAMLSDGRISAGHGRALLGADDPEAMAKTVVAEGLNVRQTEQLAKDAKAKGGEPADKARAAPSRPVKDPDTLALERDLSALLGMKVSVDFKGDGGTLAIQYQTLEQLDDLLRRLDHSGQTG